MKCPRCQSTNIEYVPSVDLAQCLNCSVVIWDEDLLQEIKLLIVQVSQEKQLQDSHYADETN
jgi:transcription initiation factor TFIIIB Brf1 subunit/transcription initiation factor TFIIB